LGDHYAFDAIYVFLLDMLMCVIIVCSFCCAYE